MLRISRPFSSLGSRRLCGVRRVSHIVLTDLQRHLEVSDDQKKIVNASSESAIRASQLASQTTTNGRSHGPAIQIVINQLPLGSFQIKMQSVS